MGRQLQGALGAIAAAQADAEFAEIGGEGRIGEREVEIGDRLGAAGGVVGDVQFADRIGRRAEQQGAAGRDIEHPSGATTVCEVDAISVDRLARFGLIPAQGAAGGADAVGGPANIEFVQMPVDGGGRVEGIQDPDGTGGVVGRIVPADVEIGGAATVPTFSVEW